MQIQADLTRCAEEILLAREHYFPATISNIYDLARMDTEFPLIRAARETPSESLRDHNDDVLERSYSDRRFKIAITATVSPYPLDVCVSHRIRSTHD